MLIDRYLSRAMIQSAVIVFISLAGLYLVFDAFTNLDSILGNAAEMGGVAALLAKYYGCRMVWFFDATSQVVTLAGAMFALSWLERHNELTALLAAGVTRWRLARPILVLAAGISLVSLANREVVLPRIRQQFARNAQDLRPDASSMFEARYDHRTEILFRGRSMQEGLQRIEGPSLLMPPQLSEFGTQIDAAEAFWRPATADHPAGYLLCGVTEPADIDGLRPLTQGDHTIIFTRTAATWLEPRQCFVASDVTFEQLIGSANWSQYSSTSELMAAIRNPSLGLGAEIPLRVHARLVAPLLDMTLVMLGIPLVLGPSRRGIFVAVGACVALTAFFFLVVTAAHALTLGEFMSPATGAWAPLLVLAPLAAWLAQPLWQ
jgi:lipopolysaccharide export system permease protein